MGQFGGIGLPFFGCVILLVGNIFLVLGFASPYWVSDESVTTTSRGLWRERRCLNTGGCFVYAIVEDYGMYLDAVRGLLCLAIIFMSAPLVVLPIYMYLAGGDFYRRTMASAAVLTLISAVCIFVGVIIYASSVSDQANFLNWSFYMAVVSGAMATLSFIVFLVAAVAVKPVSGQLINNAIYADNIGKKSYLNGEIE